LKCKLEIVAARALDVILNVCTTCMI